MEVNILTQISYPFSNSPILNEQQWQKMSQHWNGTGVLKGMLNDLQVYADSTGMQVKVKSGQASLKGIFYESDAEETLPIAAADVTNPRIDLVILRLDWTNRNILLAVLQGTPAVTPVAPALTQNSSRWEIALAQVQVNAGVSTIASVNVTDKRIFADTVATLMNKFIPENAIKPTLFNAWTNYGMGYSEIAYWKDSFGYVHIQGSAKGGTLNNTIFKLPYDYLPVGKQTFIINANNGIGVLFIDPTNGNVTPLVGNTTMLEFNNIKFRAGV